MLRVNIYKFNLIFKKKMNFTNISLEKLNCSYVADVTGGIELLNFYWSGSVKYVLLLIAYNLFSLMKQQQWTVLLPTV